MSNKSRYYDLARVITGQERMRALAHWKDPKLEGMTLLGPGVGFMPERQRLECLRNFTRAVERFGTAYEGGCLHRLVRLPDIDHRHGYQCVFAKLVNLDVFDHATFFRRDGRVTAVVGQPYEYRREHLAALRSVCGPLGVGVETGESWHYPPFSIALIFTPTASFVSRRRK